MTGEPQNPGPGTRHGIFTSRRGKRMVQPFADDFTTLNKHSDTEEPVQTQFGWHVILLDDMRDSTPPAFNDVKDRLMVPVANE